MVILNIFIMYDIMINVVIVKLQNSKNYFGFLKIYFLILITLFSIFLLINIIVSKQYREYIVHTLCQRAYILLLLT